MSEFNILIDTLPSTVMVGGRIIPIYADFRTGILYEQLMHDSSMDDLEKTIAAVELYYPHDALSVVMESKDTAKEAVDRVIWFYLGGKHPDIKKQESKTAAVPPPKRVYDFDVDAERIYAAFLSQYRVDLQDVEFLHWWKFCAMFSCLTDDHEISRVMGYRALDLSKITNKKEKARLAALQAKYRLPYTGSVEDMQRTAGALFGGMMRR